MDGNNDIAAKSDELLDLLVRWDAYGGGKVNCPILRLILKSKRHMMA